MDQISEAEFESEALSLIEFWWGAHSREEVGPGRWEDALQHARVILPLRRNQQERALRLEATRAEHSH